MTKKDVRVVFYLDEESARQLRVVAEQADRPVSWVARYIVKKWLEEAG